MVWNLVRSLLNFSPEKSYRRVINSGVRTVEEKVEAYKELADLYGERGDYEKLMKLSGEIEDKIKSLEENDELHPHIGEYREVLKYLNERKIPKVLITKTIPQHRDEGNYMWLIHMYDQIEKGKIRIVNEYKEIILKKIRSVLPVAIQNAMLELEEKNDPDEYRWLKYHGYGHIFPVSPEAWKIVAKKLSQYFDKE